MEDMQEKLKAVQEQLTSLPDMLLSRISIYEPGFAQFYKNKKDKNEKISLKEEVPQPKTWQGEAVLSYYGLECEELCRSKNALEQYPDKILKLLNERKRGEDGRREKEEVSLT